MTSPYSKKLIPEVLVEQVAILLRNNRELEEEAERLQSANDGLHDTIATLRTQAGKMHDMLVKQEGELYKLRKKLKRMERKAKARK